MQTESSPLIHVCNMEGTPVRTKGEICSVFKKQCNGHLLLKLLFSYGSTYYILKEKTISLGALTTFLSTLAKSRRAIALPATTVQLHYTTVQLCHM